MSKNRYYLFARNKDTNKVKSIPLSDLDIYGNGDNNLKKYNSLEEIDIFTTSYEKEEDVVKYLVNTNRLDSYDNELFIVSRSGDKYDYMENLYNDCPMRSEIIKLALSNEKKGEIIYENETVLNYFIGMMENRKFRKYIESKNHNIYSLFVKYFDGTYGNRMYRAKYYDGAWAMKSYVLHRNIVEAIGRFRKIKRDKTTKDMAVASKRYKDKIENPRNMSEADIIFYTEKNYNVNQLNFLYKDDEVDKISEIESFIDNINVDAFDCFSLTGDDNIIINRDFFQCSDIEYDHLNDLNQQLKKKLYELAAYKSGVASAWNCDDFIKSKSGQLIKMIMQNENYLNNLYAFMLLYKKIKNRDLENNKSYKK